MRFISQTDKKKADPVQMQVLALGHSRCATSSLQAALESDVIGMGPSLHMAHIAPYPERARWVLDAAEAPEGSPERRALLHRIFDGYGATTDFPGWFFASDLMDMYPDAPVVLNVRKTPQSWAESATASLAFFGTTKYLAACYLWETDRLHWRMHQVAYRKINERFGLEGQLYTTEYYELHNEWVRSEAKKRGRRLLEWQVQDGWAPLCEFLGREPPRDGRPFPHLNDAAAMRTLRRILVARGLLSWAAVFGLGWAVWRYSRLLF